MTDVERYLYGYRDLERKKKILENDLKDATEEYMTQQESLLTPAKPEEVKTSKSNKITDPVQDAVIKIVDVYRKRVDRISQELANVTADQDLILETIKSAGLTVMEESYIRYRYIKGMSAWTTAQRIGYSERWAQKCRNIALNKIRVRIKLFL